MNIYEDTNPRELKELLRQIHNGETVLPDFQRNFVWDPNMTMELIISIAENYPAGSLLRIRNTHNLFAHREFEGAPVLNGKKPIYLILDGQQRLTSLFQAFYGVGENKFFLDVKKLLLGADFEDVIFHLKSDHQHVTDYESMDYQARKLILPLSVLKGGSGDFGKWARKISRRQPDNKERIEMEDKLDDVEPWIQTIDDYRFPVVTLSDSTSAEAVCTIFETLNRTGVKLSPFELLTARFWPQKLNLRQLWLDAIEKYPIIEEFEVDPYYSLQIIGLLARSAPSCKRKDVMDLTKEMIESSWHESIEGLNLALTFLQQNCGVLTAKFLPYITIIVPMSAMFAKTLQIGGPKVGGAKDKISKWFWCSVFGQRYESSPTSQSALDFSQTMQWVSGGDKPESVSAFNFDPASLRNTTSRQRAVYRGTLALVMSHHSRDFYSHNILNHWVMAEHHVDDHHIFPDKFLERQKIPPRDRDCVINHTLIDSATNKRIRDRAPSKYMAEIRDERDKNKFKELLDSHLLPAGTKSPFWSDDFEGFLNWRQDRISQEIKHVTGLEEEE